LHNFSVLAHRYIYIHPCSLHGREFTVYVILILPTSEVQLQNPSKSHRLQPNFVHIHSTPRESIRPPDGTWCAPAQFSGEPKIRQESPRSTRGRVLYDKNSCLFFFLVPPCFPPVSCLLSLSLSPRDIPQVRCQWRELQPVSNSAGFLTYIQPSR
jgi:hypothetical protein